MKKAIVILFVGLMISFGLVGCDSASDSAKAMCARQAKDAKTDAAAKLIYKTCVKKASD
jgi:outer membrane lipoprotein SlyB